MSVLDPIGPGRTSCLCAWLARIAPCARRVTPSAKPSPSSRRRCAFSLDGRVEGPSALFLVPLDRGYYKSERLNVTIDEAATALEPITRVASGSHDMALADINAYIRYRDQNPSAPIQAVFMVYNRPPYAIVGRKSRGISDPEEPGGQEARRAARHRDRSAVAGVRAGERDRRRKGDAREHRHAGAGADARRRSTRRRAGIFVPAVCGSQGSRRAARRHRAGADAGLQAQALRRRRSS